MHIQVSLILLSAIFISMPSFYSKNVSPSFSWGPSSFQTQTNPDCDGTWDDGDCWVDGCIPGSTITSSQTVNIDHDIVYDLSDDLIIEGTLNIDGATFETVNGDDRSVFVDGGDVVICNGSFILPLVNNSVNNAGNFVNRGGNIEIKNSYVEVAENWDDTSDPGDGYRIVTGGCLIVGESFSNKGSVDVYNGVCITVGRESSGNFSNEWMMDMSEVSIIILGNFENNNTGSITGGEDAIVLLNVPGNLSNDGMWDAEVMNYCVGGNIDGGNVNDLTEDLIGPENCGDEITMAECNNCIESCLIEMTCSVGNHVSCNGGMDGIINVMITMGSPAYMFTVNGSSTTPTDNGGGSFSFEGLGTGGYNISVMDMDGCEAMCEIVTLTEPDELDCTINSQTNLDCNGDTDGEFTIMVSGGTPAYSFMLNGMSTLPMDNGGGSYTFEDLGAGMYTVEIADANMCMETCAVVTLSEPDELDCTINSQTNLDCNGDTDGEFTIMVSGGTPAYSFMLNGMSILPMDNGGGSYTFEDLGAGMYTVEIADANMCMETCAVVTLSEPDELDCTINSQTNLDCNGDTDGEFTIMVSGGTPAYSFMLNGMSTLPMDNGGGSYMFEDLGAGMYTVEIADANMCMETCAVVTLSEPDELDCTINSQTNLDCNGDTDGEFTIMVSGGTPAYSFMLNGMSTLPMDNGGGSYTFEDLGAGMYTVEIADANMCMETCAVVTLSEPDELDCTINSQTNLDCNGDTDGEFTIMVSGGTPAYSFMLNGMSTLPMDNGGGSYTFEDLGAGMYTVEIADANMCMETCAVVTLSEPDELDCTINSQTNLDCNGDTDGEFTIMVSGGTPAYSFMLNGMSILPMDNGGGSYMFEDLGAGMYTVEIADANMCMETCAVVTLSEPDELDCTINSQTNLDCNGDTDGEFTIMVSGGTPAYSFMLNGMSILPMDNGGGSYTFEDLGAGMYTVEIADANMCMETCAVVTLEEPVQLECLFVQLSHVSTFGGMDGEFTIAVSGGTPQYSFELNAVPNVPIDNSDGTYTFSGLSAGNYVVDIIDVNGCEVSCLEVEILERIMIGDFVWHDRNGNGIQEVGEEGIENVRVELYNDMDMLVDTRMTDEDGFYLFEDVEIGDYYLVFDVGSEYLLSPLMVGLDESIDSDVFKSGPLVQTTIRSFLTNDLSIDVGLYKCSFVGDFVWLDYNKNNIYDFGENGLNGVPVNLYKYDVVSMSWNLTETLYTSSRPGSPSDDGYFKFCTAPGTYYLEVDFILPGYVSAVPFVGPDPEIDSDITDYFGENTTYSFSVISGDEICDLGAGYYEESTVGDYAWHDANVNGIQDEGEPKLANVTVQAYDLMGGMRSETTTNSEGYYQVSNLRHDEYFLKVIAPLGMIPTYPHMGDNVEIDNDITNDNGYLTTSTISLQSGEDKGDLDLGFVVGVVPIELISFSGRNKGSYNRLEWITAFELNHKEFVLEKRFSNEPFDDYAIVPSAGSSIEEQSYHVDDVDIDRSGVYYYRLRSLDLDGSFNYSNVVAISTDDRFNDLTLLPNPWRGGKLNLVLPDFEQITRVYIYDATKRLMYVNENLEKDQFILEIEGDDWSNGVYVVYVGTARGEYVTRMIKI